VKLEITNAAIADIRSIREYTVEQWGERQDEIYSDRLWQRFEEILADAPSYRFRPDLFPGCQIASEGRHVILFRVYNGVLQVVRVLHSAMDFKRHIGLHPK